MRAAAYLWKPLARYHMEHALQSIIFRIRSGRHIGVEVTRQLSHCLTGTGFSSKGAAMLATCAIERASQHHHIAIVIVQFLWKTDRHTEALRAEYTALLTERKSLQA